jgi:hypothetical protein
MWLLLDRTLLLLAENAAGSCHKLLLPPNIFQDSPHSLSQKPMGGSLSAVMPLARKPSAIGTQVKRQTNAV